MKDRFKFEINNTNSGKEKSLPFFYIQISTFVLDKQHKICYTKNSQEIDCSAIEFIGGERYNKGNQEKRIFVLQISG